MFRSGWGLGPLTAPFLILSRIKGRLEDPNVLQSDWVGDERVGTETLDREASQDLSEELASEQTPGD